MVYNVYDGLKKGEWEMRLNSIMIYYQLAKHFEINHTQYSQQYFVGRPVFYETSVHTEGRAVIADKENILHCVNYLSGCVILCIGSRVNAWDKGNNDVIFLEEGISEKTLFNVLTEIFDVFDNWEGKLTGIVNGNIGFQEILDCCQMVLPEPAALMDGDFKYIAYSSDEGICGKFVDDMNQLPLEDVNDLTSMPGFKELEERKEAFVYTAGEVVIYKNIYHEGRYAGRLSLLIQEGQEDAKTEYEKAVFNHLARYVEQLYDQCGGFELGPQRLADLHHMLKKCLETDGADEGELLRLLWANKNLPGDIYYMLTIRENILQKGKAYNMRYLCSQMERMWPGAYCVTHDGDIAMLFNRNMFSKSTDLEFHKEMVYFLRESVLAAGCSREFTDISCIRSAYRQAEFAMEMGLRKNFTYCYHKFDDYALDFLLKYGVGNFLPEQLCSRELLTLYRYDRENETSYYKTLFTYVRLQYNAVASAKALYIHRSSFINRMERIRELIHLNLEDPEERLYLLLSFRIMEEYSSKSGEK